MIEVIYKDEKQEAKGNEGIFDLPKNIRQIGVPGEGCRIYMEDYVYTFLGKAGAAEQKEEEDGGCLAVFTGETKRNAGTEYLFIKGAILINNEEVSVEHVEITDITWQKIHVEMEQYFCGQEIVGWFFACGSMAMEITEVFLRAHLKHFGGEKVLMLMDPLEKEEAFFRYDNGFMIKENGYYIYYEKNPQMQAYMQEKNPQLYQDEREEVRDEAVHAFRRIIQKKQKNDKRNDTETEEKTSVFSYAAAACLALAVLTVGVQYYRNYTEIGLEEKISKKEDSAVSSKGVTVMPEVTKTLRLTPTSAIKREVTSTPVALTEVPVTSVIEMEVDQEDGQIYREESDTRKAEQRMRQTEAPEDEETETSLNVGIESEKASYVIKPGDTLYQISVTQYGTVDKVAEICSLNGIEEDEIIYPGQIIVLP